MIRIDTGAWILTVCAGFGALLVYGNTSGPSRPSPARWPARGDLVLASRYPTLLMFAHPHCPCTRSSLRELERLVADVGGHLRGRVLFRRPVEAEEGWEKTDLWRMAESIPGFEVDVDVDGRAARAFGAQTSGHVVVYDRGGRLVFSGGVTAARAHEGSNRGRDAIRQYALTGDVPESRTPVFGCALEAAAEEGVAVESSR